MATIHKRLPVRKHISKPDFRGYFPKASSCEYNYFDNWESGGDPKHFKNDTRRQRHYIQGCLKNEIKLTSRDGVMKAFRGNP